MTDPILLAQVKRKLNITWNDDETTARIEEIIANAIPILIHRLGIVDADFDFAASGLENNLFKSFCLYEWNHCANEFWANYADDIAQVRAKYEVQHYLKNSEGSENEE